MPLTSTFWSFNSNVNDYGGFDIHTLYGAAATIRLDTVLYLSDGGGVSAKDVFDDPAIIARMGVIKVEFIPRFDGAQAGNIYSGHGVSVDIVTGQVTAVAPAIGQPRLRNFVIEARTTVPDPANPGANTDQLFLRQIRVHIHEAVQKIWLTPSSLTVAKGTTGHKFSILALFDDGITGDITRMEGLTWRVGPVVNPDVTIDAAKGNLTVNNFPVQKDITVTLPAGVWGAAQATASMTGVGPWDGLTPEQYVANLLAGPGADKLGEATNILILSEGFRAADKEDFDTLLIYLIDQLRNSKVTRPYDLFLDSGAINFWSVFLPSPEKPASILFEVQLNGESASPAPVAKKPDPNTDWTIENFIYQVGLPTSKEVAEFNAVLPTVNYRQYLSEYYRDLTHLPAGIVFPPGLRDLVKYINGQLYYLGRMTEANKNTLLGLSADADYRKCVLKLFMASQVEKMRYDTIDTKLYFTGVLSAGTKDFLVTMADTDVAFKNTILDFFLLSKQSYQAQIADWKILYGAANIPDARLAVNDMEVYATWVDLSTRILLNELDTALGLAFGERPCEDRTSLTRVLDWHALRTSRAEMDLFIQKITDGFGFNIGSTWTGTGKDRPLIVVLSGGSGYGGVFSGGMAAISLGTDSTTNVAQEPNSKGYIIIPYELDRRIWGSAKINPVAFGTLVHELSHALQLGDEYGESFQYSVSNFNRDVQNGNVQIERDLLAAGSPTNIDGDKLLWRWPRIQKAAVLTAKPFDMTPAQPALKEYVLSLRPGEKNQFVDDDIVYLRQRPLLKPAADPNNPVVNPAEVSGRLKITQTTQLLEQVVVIDIDNSLDANKFSGTPPFESVLFMPVPAPEDPADPVPPGEFAELVARVIRQHIRTTGAPLNRAAPAACAVDDNKQQSVATLPSISFNWYPINKIVGAYDGGHTCHCGAYHPTGECMMRGRSETDDNILSPFCAVCIYFLVDQINPALHPRIDADYEYGYPIPATP